MSILALSQAEIFNAAASMLMEEVAVAGTAGDLLMQLGYLGETAGDKAHHVRLLHAAAGFSRMFTLKAEDAPGLVTFGAEIDPHALGAEDAPLVSVSGCGLTLRRAFEACVGEGVEHLSQYAMPSDLIEQLPPEQALDDASPALRALWDRLSPYNRLVPDRAMTGWTVAATLATGQPVRLPADLCFRRRAKDRDVDPPWPLSIGCAAGPDYLSATLHGLLELVERDAVALWWRGGERPRVLAADIASAILSRLRKESERRTWLLDITSDTGVPVIVAASCNDDGYGLCCGFAARTTRAAAASAAVLEMAQMELAYRLTAMKRATYGEAALNEIDKLHVRRFTTINVGETLRLQPQAPPLPACDLNTPNAQAALNEVRRRLDLIGLAPSVLNLTRDSFGIPVTRVVCPGLEIGMSSPPGPRLSAVSERLGIPLHDAALLQ